MALEIFEVFRRRQKAILAWLAVLAMFLFIIGDVLIGVRMGHYGLGYGLRRLFYDTRLEELEAIHDQRQTAMMFLIAARQQAEKLLQETKFRGTDLSDIKDENVRKQYFEELRKANDTWCGDIYARAYELARFGLASYEFPLTADGLLEFVYWKQEADRVGIVISAEMMRQDFETFTFRLLPESEWYRIVQSLRRTIAPEVALQWLADEIRASLAKQVCEGTNQNRVIHLTPFDLWEAYRDLQTVLPQVAVATLNVHEDRFSRAVSDPDEGQLRAYFDQYKHQEPDPMRLTPGFRVPTRYRIEFIYADFRYDLKDPAKTGEAWPAYRHLVESLNALGALFQLTPAVSSAGGFLPCFAVAGFGLRPVAYGLYLAHREQRYRIPENFASYALTNTSLHQRVHHHGILPAGTGPWYFPGASEAEQGTQLALQPIPALFAAATVPMPVVALVRPVSVKASLVDTKAIELAAMLGRTIGLTLAQAAPGLAGTESSQPIAPHQVKSLAAASFLAQVAGSVMPVPLEDVFQSSLRQLIESQAASLLPGYEGLTITGLAPQIWVPFAAVAEELELEFLRSEIGRLVQADLDKLKSEIRAYGQEYQKAYSQWRKRSKGGTPFVPPAYGPNTEPFEQYLQRYCQPRGLRYFPMKQLRSRYELLPRQSGELGKILYPLYQEVRPMIPSSRPIEIWNRELEFADALITGQEFLIEAEAKPGELKSTGIYSLYEPRFLIPLKNQAVRAMVWKAEEAPGYVPGFEEARDTVRQAWRKEQARKLALEHAQRLAEQIRLRKQRQAPMDDILKELKGNPEFVELTRIETVELRRYQFLPVSPLTGLEKALPGPQLEPIRYPPIVDYPESDFLSKAYQHLRAVGDTWITTNQPGDKVYVFILVQPPREPSPLEFEADYLKRPYESRLRVHQLPLDTWVRTQRASELRKQFLQFLRQRYGLDDDKYRQLEDLTRRSR